MARRFALAAALDELAHDGLLGEQRLAERDALGGVFPGSLHAGDATTHGGRRDPDPGRELRASDRSGGITGPQYRRSSAVEPDAGTTRAGETETTQR
jgi:hypothetical protein